MDKIKFEKMALYRSKDFLLKNVGIPYFKKGIIELIPEIELFLSEKLQYLYSITYEIGYNQYTKNIQFLCTNFKSYTLNEEDIFFKRKNGTYKVRINFEPFIFWYKYTLIPELKEFLKNKKHKYSPKLDTHINNILIKNRIDYINKIIYD